MEESNQPGQTTTPEGELSQGRDTNASAPKQPTTVPKEPAEQPASPQAQTPSAPDLAPPEQTTQTPATNSAMPSSPSPEDQASAPSPQQPHTPTSPASGTSATISVSTTPKQILLLLIIFVLSAGAAIAGWYYSKGSGDNTVPIYNQDTSYASSSHDDEIKTDLVAVATQLEAYYADFGYYPGGNNGNKCDGPIGSNMSCDLHALLPTRGLDPAAFINPEGKDLNEPGGYVYIPAPNGCAKCEGFELSAILSDGSVYSKNSLN